MERRPLDVVLIAIYFAGFSAVLLGILVWQLGAHHIHATWLEKMVVLPILFLIAMLPGVLAAGLWMLDNAARIASILFALLHAVGEFAFLANLHIPSRSFTVLRIALDAVIIACLCRRGVRNAFQWKPMNISLRNPDGVGPV